MFRVDRTGIAIVAAALMVVTGVVPWDRAVGAGDARTLVLAFLVRELPLAVPGLLVVFAVIRRRCRDRLRAGADLEEVRSAGIEIGFLEYCTVGVPVTVVTLSIGWLILSVAAV